MPSYRRRRFRPMSFQQTLATYVQGPGLPFHDVLDEHVINRVAEEIQTEFDSTFGKIFTLTVVLWAFLTQVSAEDRSCRAAVMRILAFRKRSAQPACSTLTGAYCKARQKLSDRFLHRLVLHVGHKVEDQAPDAWRWKDRRAILVDGTTVTAPDTPKNQAAYPQPEAKPEQPFFLDACGRLERVSSRCRGAVAYSDFVAGSSLISILRMLTEFDQC